MSNCYKTILILLISTISYQCFAQELDRYKLEYNKESSNVISVQAKLRLEDSLLYMSQYGSLSGDYPKYIRNLEIMDIKGNPVKYHFEDSLRWVLDDIEAGQMINLYYDLAIEHEQQQWPGGIDGVAYAREFGVMASGRSLFILNGQEKKNIQVRVKTPDEIKASASWVEIAGQPGSFEVSDLEKLQEAFLFLGTHQEVLINRESFTLKFILGGEKIVAQKDQLIKMGNELLDYYIALMGGIPKPAPGSKLDQAMVIITENDNVDGEVIGNHISMFMNPEGDPQSQMIGWFIFAHEFFHLWNGKSLQFVGSSSDWFKEGVSNYYTLKGLNKVGFIDKAGYEAILNNLFYQRYINDPGLGEKSPVDSAEGFSKDNHWGLIYGGGLFTGIASDMQIRHRSANQKSLDDLMRELYKEYAGSGNLIDNEVLKNKITDFGFGNFDSFFNAYLSGTETISLEPYLLHAGVEVIYKDANLLFSHKEEKTRLQEEIWQGFLGGTN